MIQIPLIIKIEMENVSKLQLLLDLWQNWYLRYQELSAYNIK